MIKTLILILTLTTLNTFANDNLSEKIAVIDLEKAINLHPEYNKYSKKIKDIVQSNQKRLSKKENEYVELIEQLKKQKDILNDKAKKRKAEEVLQKEQELHMLKLSLEEDILKEKDRYERLLYNDIKYKLKIYNKDKKYSFIANKNNDSFMLIENVKDITNEFIKFLEKEYK